jgi:hypothetical protein
MSLYVCVIRKEGGHENFYDSGVLLLQQESEESPAIRLFRFVRHEKGNHMDIS